jgi:hypothetical protein
MPDTKVTKVLRGVDIIELSERSRNGNREPVLHIRSYDEKGKHYLFTDEQWPDKAVRFMISTILAPSIGIAGFEDVDINTDAGMVRGDFTCAVIEGKGENSNDDRPYVACTTVGHLEKMLDMINEDLKDDVSEDIYEDWYKFAARAATDVVLRQSEPRPTSISEVIEALDLEKCKGTDQEKARCFFDLVKNRKIDLLDLNDALGL